MTTGVDAQTCKLIVLDQHIQSMTEFKQIIGRGTRINEDFGKFYFTIMDFKKATELFADPNFDGDPVCVYKPKGTEPPVPPDEEDSRGDTETPSEGIQDSREGAKSPSKSNDDEHGALRYVVDKVPVMVVAERVQYYDPSGKLVTESLKEYTKRAVNKEFSSMHDFLNRWTKADRKQAIITEMAQHGVFFEALAEDIGKDCDPFDLVCHVAWDQPPLTRRERAEQVKKRNYFTQYGDKARKVLEALLEKYADQGVEHIEETSILSVTPFTQLGTPVEIIKAFGGLDAYQKAIHELETALYCA